MTNRTVVAVAFLPLDDQVGDDVLGPPSEANEPGHGLSPELLNGFLDRLANRDPGPPLDGRQLVVLEGRRDGR